MKKKYIHSINFLSANKFQLKYIVDLKLYSTKSSSEDTNPYYKGMDAYQILEISRSAPQKDIKKAYRKLIAKWHPDKFPNDPEKKKEGGLRLEKINRAYYCLETENRRQRYDRFGEAGIGSSAAAEEQMEKSGGPGFGGFGDMSGFGGFSGFDGAVNIQDISDIFSSFFQGSGGPQQRGGWSGRSDIPRQGNFLP